MLWLLLGIIALFFVLLNTPAVQKYIGGQASKVLSEKFGTKVEVGRIDVGILNRIIVDDLIIYDQSGTKMLGASRLSAHFELSPLLQGKIALTSAQLFGLKATLYQKDGTTPPNYQFLLDSLASKDTTSTKPLDLRITSLVVRHGEIRYDRLDTPSRTGQLHPHHLHLTDLSGHVMLNQLTDDRIDIKVKKISFKEASGLDLRHLSLNLLATKKQARLTDLELSLPSTHLKADTLEATYQTDEEGLIPSTLAYRGKINQLEVDTEDLSFILPSQLTTLAHDLRLSTHFTGTHNSLQIHSLNLSTDNHIQLSCSGSIDDIDRQPQWLVHVGRLEVPSVTLHQLSKESGLNIGIPPQILNMGNISYVGDLGGKSQEYALRGQLNTDAGNANLTVGLQGNRFNGHVETEKFDLSTILGDETFGILATEIDVDGRLPLDRSMSLYAKGHFSRLDFKGKTYTDISVDGLYDNASFNGVLGIEDPQGQIGMEGKFDLSTAIPSANITAHIRHLHPESFGLEDWKGRVIDLDLTTDISGNDLDNLVGQADISHLHISTTNKEYHLEHLHIDADNDGNEKHILIESDFGDAHLQGNYDLRQLPGCISGIIGSKLPSLSPHLPKATTSTNDFTFTANIDRSDWLKQISDIPLTINAPMHISGHIDNRTNYLALSLNAPSIEYDGHDIREIECEMTTRNDTLFVDANAIKMQEDGDQIDLAIQANASSNILGADLAIVTQDDKHMLHGNLSSMTEFVVDSHGHLSADVQTRSSQIFIYDIPWQVEPSHLQLSSDEVMIDRFLVRNNNQYVKVSGALTANPNDTISVDLNHLNAEFLSDMLDVKGVDFGGMISGQAMLTSVYDTPNATAHLNIDDFKFSNGRIGEMEIEASWNQTDNQIVINGHATDNGQGTTDVNGHIGLSPGDIDITIIPDGTPLSFLETYCSSFISDISLRGKGHLRLFGPLSNINLEGQVVGNGNVTVSSLNTQYKLVNDTVTLIPNHILFKDAAIYDREGHVGIVNGSVNHDELSDFNFDIHIDADHLLSYDFKDFGGDTFCGTVYASGNCHLSDQTGDIVIDVEATPEQGTIFYYNAASPDALSSQDFIQWNDITPEAIDYSQLPSASDSAHIKPVIHTIEKAPKEEEISSNLRMNFRLNVTPDATLRLLMDAESGDYIALNGSGALRANYFNKGTFNLYGNYLVDHGVYKLTIQNVIKKDFQFQRGGTISFGGNPYDAILDLKALYTINSVSLSDLNVGNSFTNNNIRVNCLMNITGTPNQPIVDFDLELPTMSSDAQQMVKSIIDSEESRNQQVIYLLAIGRFYNQNYTAMNEQAQSQTSLAMQSLLSGTISQQINSLLSNVVHSNNWNFGANISTGDQGLNNAEYEGLLSGSLLNNRLLINGQFGYRDNPNATTSFIGDFDIQYLLYPNGNLAVKVYNQTNDRYFIKNSLNTQGIGLIMKKDFNGWRELLGINRKRKQLKR